MKRFFSFFLSFTLLMIALGGVFLFVPQIFYTPPSSSHSDESDSVIFEITKGSSLSSVGEKLKQKGLISHPIIFNLYARIFGYAGKLRVGEYQISRSLSTEALLKILSSGKSIEYPLLFQEGINIYEMAQLLENRGFGTAQQFLQLVHDKELIQKLLQAPLSSLEGYLFPETYHLTKYTTQRELIEKMVQRFLVVWGELHLPTQVDWRERHKIVTLSSIVEKETGVPEERARVAAVFRNRLIKGMRLQSDPTILYGMMELDGKMKLNITRKDIETYTPYNTYRVNSLPSGPICNPGKGAIQGVLHPESSPYLYFVSRNDGTHFFSETLEKHNQAVRHFQLDRHQRESKSWRDRLPSKQAR